MQPFYLLTNLGLFSSYLSGIANTPILLLSILALTGIIFSVLACFGSKFIAGLIHRYGGDKFNNKCPRCAAQGITVYVLPGKHCRRCNQPC
jgi:hypothetical protein